MMNASITPSNHPRRITPNVIAWVARALSVVSITLIALMASDGAAWPTPRQWIVLAAFPIGVVAGMLVGWWRTLAGGLISVGSLGAFYLVHLAMVGKFPAGPYFAIFALPGLLFLVSGLLARAPRH